MAHEQLFASFILDREENLEIALPADKVTEATGISNQIKALPASVDFLEGIMQLRDEVIPIINLKQRLGLAKSSYNDDAKVAVVNVFNQRFGLLFDDIKDVIRIDSTDINPIPAVLQTDDRIISDLINIAGGSRTVELLDLNYLFPEGLSSLEETDKTVVETEKQTANRSYSRYVIFSCTGQEYGVRVEHAQELSFLTNIDELYRDGSVEGALQLRGHTIPVVDAGALLHGTRAENTLHEDRRILILHSDELSFGLIVDEAREILTIPDDEILSMPGSSSPSVTGIYPYLGNRNITLLDIGNLIGSQTGQLKSIGRVRKDLDDEEDVTGNISHNLITENCYLIFFIDKNYAIELKDVQEIIVHNKVLSVPAASGFNNGIINLRGQIVPVVNLRRFYDYPDKNESQGTSKLIICRGKSQIVALEVDDIVTIYKQEQYYPTPALKPQLSARKDTLDRLIEFHDDSGISEHVLVINTHNLLQNHLGLNDEGKYSTNSKNNQP